MVTTAYQPYRRGFSWRLRRDRLQNVRKPTKILALLSAAAITMTLSACGPLVKKDPTAQGIQPTPQSTQPVQTPTPTPAPAPSPSPQSTGLTPGGSPTPNTSDPNVDPATLEAECTRFYSIVTEAFPDEDLTHADTAKLRAAAQQAVYDRTKKNLLSLADKAEQGDDMGIANVSMDQAQFCYLDTFSGDFENLTSDLDEQFAELDEQLEELDKMLEDLESGS